jgi:hypothetical protein
MKVNKAYSLDIETIKMIEDYTHGGVTSRSALVNDAIKWYIKGDVIELVEANKQLQERFGEAMRKLNPTKPRHQLSCLSLAMARAPFHSLKVYFSMTAM